MTSVTVQQQFDQPVEQVWAVVSDFGGIATYMKGVESCTTEGQGIGQDRSIAMGGGTVVERLTWLDHDQHDLSYTILSGPLPFSRYVATVRLSPDGVGTLATWEGNFEPAGVSEEEASKLARGIYTGGLKGYKAHLDG
ncbi:MAG: SRPBCC family protein [Acidimicrobiia bacterium]|nr:SRPBCC family protein [Acidimicrobiia bacterium]